MTDQADTFPFGAAFDAISEADWRALAEKVLKGAPFERLVSRTADGIAIQPLTVTPPGGLQHVVRPLRESALPWSVLTRIDHPQPTAANQQAHDDLTGGARGLHLVFAGAAGSYGFGLPIGDPGDLRTLLANIDPAQSELAMDLPPDAGTIALALADLIADSGLNPANALVAFGLNPLAALTLHKANPGDADDLIKIAVEQSHALSKRGFSGPFVRIDARAVHAAGASEAQELAWLLAGAVTLFHAFENAGVTLEKARNYFQFTMAVDTDQFASIAKLRALRRLMARVEDACGMVPAPVKVHAETAWRMMTRTDPWSNVLRSTIATFSAITGGADGVCVLPHTQAAGLPDTEARRLARNVQLILQEESHLASVADPAAGAGGIEALTDALCDKTWSLFQEVEAAGGLIASVSNGVFGAWMATAREKRIDEIAHVRHPITGTSTFPNITEVRDAAEQPITDDWACTMRPNFRPYRLSEPFEMLRQRATQALADTSLRPGVFLANLGPLADHNARTNFAINCFAAGGIATVSSASQASIETIAAEFAASGFETVCLCASDKVYAEQAPAIIAAMKDNGAQFIILAGQHGDNDAKWRSAGLDRYIYQGCNVVDTLNDVLDIMTQNNHA